MDGRRAGALVALTLTAGTLGIAGPAAAAECGTPAVDAVYETISHPALTHVEIRWTRTVVDSPAQPAWDEPPTVVPPTITLQTVVITPAWDQVVEITPAWDQTIEDQPAQPAVYQVLHKWVHAVTGAERWEPADWNGNSTSTSWLVTAETRPGDLITPAVPAVTHVVHHEAVTQVIHHDAVTITVPVITPGSTTPGAHHDAVPAVTHDEELWAADSPGSDWVDSGDSRVVVDQAAWDEDVLVTPAQPAGPECPTDPGEPGDPEDPGTPDDDGAVTDGGSVEVVQPATSGTRTTHTTPRASAEASAVPARLASTGSDTAAYAVIGVVLLAGGAAITVRARRMQG